MIKFSVKNQAFYDTSLSYGALPSDLMDVSNDQHRSLLASINSGCVVLKGLKISPVKPSEFHTWNGTSWVDNRTAEQIAEHERSIMPTLSPIEFDIKLNKNGLYDAVQELIKDNFELRIAYNRATFFSRTDSFIEQARQLLSLTNDQIDQMWKAP